MNRAWILALALLAACGGTQKPTTIAAPQDYERVAGEIVARIIEIFEDGGINCNMLSGDLRALNGSQKVAAAKAWRKDHPDDRQVMKAAISARKPELDKVMAPASKQCQGPIQGLVTELTE